MSEKQEKQKPSYYSVIPATIRYCKGITMLAKMMYGEITALSNKEGYCFASNIHFAELYECSISTIIRAINSLVEFNFITREIIKDKTTNQVIERKLYINDTPKKIRIFAGMYNKNDSRGGVKNDSRGGVIFDTYNSTRNIIVQDINKKEIKNKEKENQIKQIYENQNQKTSILPNYYPSEKTFLELENKIKFLNNFENGKYIIYLDEQISKFKLYYKQRTDKKYDNWDKVFENWIFNQMKYILEKLTDDKRQEFLKLKNENDKNISVNIEKLKKEIIESLKTDKELKNKINYTPDQINQIDNLVLLQGINANIKLVISSMVNRSLNETQEKKELQA
jgi:hypothetical protein